MIIEIVVLVFGILQIILFFKIWGMTNDIKAIKKKYLSSDLQNKVIANSTSKAFKVGDLVVELTTGKKMLIKRMTERGKYSCYTDGGTVHVGDFTAEEIKLF